MITAKDLQEVMEMATKRAGLDRFLYAANTPKMRADVARTFEAALHDIFIVTLPISC
jgi:hypothetical protein